MSKRNVTVVLDEETARWVRVEAALADRSVSQFLGEILREHRTRAGSYDTARRRFLARGPGALRVPGARLPRREDLYDRSALRDRSVGDE